MPSNVTAMRCTRDEIYVRGANGAEWTRTRAQILAIYALKTGSTAARRTATITDVLNSMQAALGANQAAASLAALDFDPLDPNKDLILTLN